MSFRSYNAFLRVAKRQGSLNHKQAQAAYRAMREHVGRSLKGVDVARHPRIFKRYAEEAKRKRKPGGKGVRGLRRITSISEWNRLFHGPTDQVKIVSSADYGLQKRGRK